eukprot:TRINITY_DN4962_c0_g1_i21.p1 TRINITY_DN4962_c0_g1~~TRINITY_DN4962_c0_g1_i21.p1  ORF type:complete len:233 (+),score=18.30 TRINITY_DN4962_c0_g1_i21:249-947(+)
MCVTLTRPILFPPFVLGICVWHRFLSVIYEYVCQCLSHDIFSLYKEMPLVYIPPILDCIRFFRVYDAFVLLNILEQFKANLIQKCSPLGKCLRLIVIDSINTLLTSILGGCQRQGHNMLVAIGRMLKELAVEHNIIVIVTNSVTQKPLTTTTVSTPTTATNSMQTSPTATLSLFQPALGATWFNIPSVRVIFSKDLFNVNCFVATLVHSNIHKRGDHCEFEVWQGGLRDRMC